MKRAFIKFIIIYVMFMAFFALQRTLFLMVYQHITHASAAQWFAALGHGLSMDASVAGYLTIIPALLIILSVWIRHRWVHIVERVYFATTSFFLSMVTVLDLVLYGYWGFRLDTTPFFYFTTSPAAAMASAEWWQLPVGIVVVVAMSWGLFKAFVHLLRLWQPPYTHSKATSAMLVVLTALMFIPIRGGVTVSTMNLSRAYFSDNMSLNHAAVNPLFSLIYSMRQQHDLGNTYRFTDDARASKLFHSLEQVSDTAAPTDKLSLSTSRPDIYLIILESFSSHLLSSLGGEDIASGLDSMASSGVLFTNIFASSFRTDRALPAILSGFPGQPSMSIMKYVGKVESLPSISEALTKAGYASSYYYGGDINFTNMKSYLVHSLFSHIVSDKDFSLGERLSKWGAPDHLVFNKALVDSKGPHDKPQFTVIQTSSSHEPYDVPYDSKRFATHKKLNAFAYADHCVAAFVSEVRKRPAYDNTLIIIVADHYGVYPENLQSPLERHRVPLIMTGGALRGAPARISTIGSQTDIAATLLSLLGLDAGAFEFSHNLLQPGRRGYAFFSERSLAALVTDTDTTVYNLDAMQIETHSGKDKEGSVARLKGYLQHLYCRIAGM